MLLCKFLKILQIISLMMTLWGRNMLAKKYQPR